MSQNFRVSSSIASLKCDLFSDQIDLQAKKEQSQVEYSCAFFSSHFREVFLNYIRLIHDQLNFCEVSRYDGFHHFGQSPPNFVLLKSLHLSQALVCDMQIHKQNDADISPL